MSKVGIIGIGHVGSTVTHTLIERNIATELNLYDHDEARLLAEQRDLLIGQIGTGHTIPININQTDKLATCDIIIFAAGDITILNNPDGTRFDELNFTKTTVAEWAPIIKQSGFNGVIINITNPCDVITRLMQELTGLPTNQVFGTGVSLDSARYMQVIGDSLALNPESVHAYMLGEHGETQFGAWSTGLVGQTPLSKLISPTELDKFADKARYDGWLVINGKGYTSYGIANQACQLVQAVTTNSHKLFPVSAYDPQAKLYIGHLAIITALGVEKVITPQLSSPEQAKWDASVAWIDKMYLTI